MNGRNRGKGYWKGMGFSPYIPSGCNLGFSPKGPDFGDCIFASAAKAGGNLIDSTDGLKPVPFTSQFTLTSETNEID